MRSDRVVDNEIARMTARLKNWRLSREGRIVMREQINALSLRLTPEQVKQRCKDDYALWLALDVVARWLVEEQGVNAPSEGLARR